MGTTHTSGPWAVTIGRLAGDDPAFGFTVTATGKRPPVCGAGVYQPLPMTLASGWPNHPDAAEFFTSAELEANARLIAAAPAMLAVLTEAVASTGSAHPRECGMHQYVPAGRSGIVKQGPCDCWVGRAVAVIAAATTPGETP